jgi:diaminopimelate epimerase
MSIPPSSISSVRTAGAGSAAGPTLQLTKHHGLGNDFLVAVLDDAEAAAALASPVLARHSCDRRRGIGADGFIVAAPTGEAGVDAVMTLFNADGSRAEMSGNGVRCLAQALARHRGTDHADLVVATDGGRRTLQVRPHPTDAASVLVRVGMGPVRPGPVWTPGDAARRALSALDPAGPRAETADIGNPHLVVAVPDPCRVDVARVGPLLEADFPAGMNVHFIAVRPGRGDALDLTVWERGAGVTEACGTGASAAATVAHRWGLVGPTVTVTMPGGTVEVVVGPEQTELIGPSTFIARIEVDLA